MTMIMELMVIMMIYGNDSHDEDLLSVGAHPLNPKVKPLAVPLRVQVRPDNFDTDLVMIMIITIMITMMMMGPFAHNS